MTKLKRRGGNGDRWRIPVKKGVPISTIVPLYNFRRLINGRVGLIGVFECQLCHVEHRDTVIGRVGRRHIGLVMPFTANHDHLVCCLSSVASVCGAGEERGWEVGPKPAKGGEGENKELVNRRSEIFLCNALSSVNKTVWISKSLWPCLFSLGRLRRVEKGLHLKAVSSSLNPDGAELNSLLWDVSRGILRIPFSFPLVV